MTVPTPGLMDRAVAPDSAQLSVLDCPTITCAGTAVKLLIVGRVPAMTAAVAVVEPKVFVAVSV